MTQLLKVQGWLKGGESKLEELASQNTRNGNRSGSKWDALSVGEWKQQKH